jgi:predicted DNA-binding ribbon-helix-helix protein
MTYVRTQIYLEPEQHLRLKAEAHRRSVSIAELIRKVLDEAFGREERPGDLTALIGIGTSEGGDVSTQKDRWVAEAIAAHHQR